MEHKDKVNEAVQRALNACMNVVSAKSSGFSPIGRVYVDTDGRALGLVYFGGVIGIMSATTGQTVDVPVQVAIAVGESQTQHLQLAMESANKAALSINSLFEGMDGGDGDAGDEALIQEARKHQA
jgi:hypothetical protein